MTSPSNERTTPMTKTAITNDKPKGALDPATSLAVNIAMELGRALGRKEAGGEPEPEPVVNRKPGPFGAKAPTAQRPGHIPPKAADTPAQNRSANLQNGEKPNPHRAPAALKQSNAED